MTSASARLRWVVLLALWAGFALWYTNLGGPLDAAEIDAYVARAQAQGRSADSIARLRRFMAADDGGQFIMVNVLDLAPQDAAANLDRYMAHMWPALLARACHPIFAGPAIATALDLSGIQQASGGAEVWDQAALMRYRSLRDLLDIALDPAFEGPHEFKLAALTKTIAFPVAPVLYPSDPRVLLAGLLLLVGLLVDRFAQGQGRSPAAP